MRVQVSLEPHEDAAHLIGPAQFGESVAQRPVLELQQRRQLLDIELIRPLLDLLGQHEVNERLMLVRALCCSPLVCRRRASKRLKCHPHSNP